MRFLPVGHDGRGLPDRTPRLKARRRDPGIRNRAQESERITAAV